MGNLDRVRILEDSLAQTPLVPATSFVVSFTNFKPYVLSAHENLEVPIIEVTSEKTQDALLRFQDQNVTVLNFASGVSPGGGVRYGASAQEEDLCLCSNLLPELEGLPEFYEKNQTEEAPPECYDEMIVSKNVSFFKDGSYRPVQPVALAEVITYPAPNIGRLEESPRGLRTVVGNTREPFQWVTPSELAEKVFERRILHVLYQARALNTGVLILGAWGCGAYGNDPFKVAMAFKKAIHSIPSVERIVFAIYGNKKNQDTFHKVFGV